MVFSKNLERLIRRPYLVKSFDGQLTILLEGSTCNGHTLDVLLAVVSLDTNEMSTDFTILRLFLKGKNYSLSICLLT